MKPTTATLLIFSLALTSLAAGTRPSIAQAPAPQINIQRVPAESMPADAAAQVPAPPAKKNTEVLPWADKPLAPLDATPVGDLAAVEAAAAQCSGLFEAACRDLKTCAWVADVTLTDGTLVPARCAARPPAPPRKAAKKKTEPAKKTAKAQETSGETTAAPAVRASVTRIEDTPAAAEKQEKTAVAKEPEAAPVAEKPAPVAPVVERSAPVEPPAVQAKAPAPAEDTASDADSKKAEEKKAETETADAPPAAAQTKDASAQMPSFGSISRFGGGNAVVVTVPPSSDSSE